MMRWLVAVALLSMSVQAGPGHAEPRSGYADAGPETRAMQDDDTANPGFLWVQQGETLWASGAPSCQGCHGPPASMHGVAAGYPAFDASLNRPVTLAQRINLCRTGHQHEMALAPDSDTMLALTALVGLQSRGMKLDVPASGPMTPFYEAGRTLFTTQQGQLGLSCSQCHETLAGQHLGGSLIPQGQPNGYPLYRLEWQSMGSLVRRIRNCLTGIRAEPYASDAPELTAIEVYLAARAKGLTVETPAVRP